jgi:DEAD/DEAH box helicase domain-containing protein
MPRSPAATRPGARTIDALVDEWRADADVAERVVHVERLAARPARTTALARRDAVTDAACAALGVDPAALWTHQATAVDAVDAGRSVVVATGTASGKSLAFQVPMARAAADGGTTLALFPTKALARDQVRRAVVLERAVAGMTVVPVDGDTPPEQRNWARRHASAVFTNPDTVHQVLLPDHDRWAGFLAKLSLVVLDEVHTLRGVFGAHVAHVIRRLRRVAAAHGASPTFVCTSATLGEPDAVAAFASTVTGVDCVAVCDDASPQPARSVVVWNPELLDVVHGIRRSALVETADVAARCVAAGLQTLGFASSRKGVEVVAQMWRERLVAAGAAGAADAVLAYRGGYLPAERRDIEERIASGDVRGVAATNALELGMDIGGLDAVVLCGFPGTVASFRQQIGRVGRGDRPALAVFVAGPDQLDQWYAAHPDQLFARPSETPVVNPANPQVAAQQLVCAAYDRPLDRDEPLLAIGGGDDGDDELGVRAAPLVADGLLRLRGDRLHAAVGRSPARSVSIRSGSDSVTIIDVDSARPVGTVDTARAPTAVHPGAVYLHQGATWVVDELDLEHRRALVARRDVDYRTQPRTRTDIEILAEDAVVACGDSGVTLSLGSVRTTRHVLGYRVRDVVGGADADGAALAQIPARAQMVPLDLAPQSLETRAVWWSVPDDALEQVGIDTSRLPGVVHAAEHTTIAILPRLAVCDRWDVGGVSMAAHPDTAGGAVWFIHDGHPGGTGIVEIAFARGAEHARAAWQVIDACGCTDGCPSCVQSPKCGNWNDPLDKDGARDLLALIAGVRATS